VVLLADARWPLLPGVCCWRHAIREAFAAAGAEVMEVAWRPTVTPPAPTAAARPRPRLAWLPRFVRQPLVWTYRTLRRSGQALRQRRVTAGVAGRVNSQRRLISAQLQGAALVVAESAEAAVDAVNAGTPARRAWALALPADWWVNPATDPAARAAATGRIGGLLTDSELAREALERATAATRVRVEVFPPIAGDRECPVCRSTGSLDMPAPPAVGDDVPGPCQLAAWRALTGPTSAAPPDPPYSFPAARLRGPTASWAPPDRSDWSQTTTSTPLPVADPGGRADWSTGAQDRAARAVLDAVAPPHLPVRRRPPRTALVSGFDLKFARELAEHLDDRPDLDVIVDEWPGLAKRSPATARLAAAAGSILAEWARPNAVWLTQQKRPGQILVVRLHRYELDSPYPSQIDTANVDAVVYVSPPIKHRIQAELGWPVEKLVHIPNFLAVARFDRPKLPEARFGLGLVGMEWMNKRFDLALDLLAALRRQDRRFTLFVRSVMPWANRYAWARPAERQYVSWCFERIERDPLLRGAVNFDPPGRDMPRWYRKVGHMLSMSDIESFHMAAAEGMASGAVPAIRPWPGAAEIYRREWIHGSIEDAAAAVLVNADPDAWQDRAERAKAEIARKVDPAAVVQAWADLLHGDLAAARSQFQDRWAEEVG
jgi:hypothetical protein